MYFVYLAECEDKTIYTGITTDLIRRLEQHKTQRGGHYTSAHRVKKIVYTEEHPTRSAALRREAEIKSWKRDKKLDLIKRKKRIG